MKRALIDVDGVIAAYAERYIEIYNRVSGELKTMSDVTDWDFEVCFEREKVLRSHIESYTHRQGYAHTISEYTGAINAVRKLMTIADVVFVTSPLGSRTWAKDREEWLEERFGKCRIISTKEKECVYGNVFVDDKELNCLKWQEAWPKGKVFLWGAPYNVNSALFRTNDWEKVYEACM